MLRKRIITTIDGDSQEIVKDVANKVAEKFNIRSLNELHFASCIVVGFLRYMNLLQVDPEIIRYVNLPTYLFKGYKTVFETINFSIRSDKLGVHYYLEDEKKFECGSCDMSFLNEDFVVYNARNFYYSECAQQKINDLMQRYLKNDSRNIIFYGWSSGTKLYPKADIKFFLAGSDIKVSHDEDYYEQKFRDSIISFGKSEKPKQKSVFYTNEESSEDPLSIVPCDAYIVDVENKKIEEIVQKINERIEFSLKKVHQVAIKDEEGLII